MDHVRTLPERAVLYSADPPTENRRGYVHGVNPSYRMPRVILDINRANIIDFTEIS